MSDRKRPVDDSSELSQPIHPFDSLVSPPQWEASSSAASRVLPKDSSLISTKRTEYFQVGRFNSGGMADVYIGLQRGADGFERLVVIKQVQADILEDESVYGMFLDEARVAAHLNHPNVVRIHDLVLIDDQVSIVMEYIDGEPLEFFRAHFAKDDRAIPLAIACSLVAQACEGLAYAHGAEAADGTPLHIVHRDIDLKNLIIDSNGYLKIIDFGMARFSAQRERTAPGLLKGKFAYLAPEYVKTGKIDERADIYALGMVFYELITGVFARNVSRDDDPQKVFEALDKPPIPATTFNPALPKSVDGIIDRVIHPEASKRYQTALEFGRELRLLANAVDHLFNPSEIAIWYKTYFEQRQQARLKWERNVMERARILIQDRGKSKPDGRPTEFVATNETDETSAPISTESASADDKQVRYPRVQIVLGILLVIALAVAVYTFYQLQQTKQALSETLDEIQKEEAP